MHRSAALIGATLAALLTGPALTAAHAAPPASACAGPSTIDSGMTATVCLATGEISGNSFVGPTPGTTHVRFGATNRHYVACHVVITLQNATAHFSRDNRYDCRQPANRQQDFAPPTNGQAVNCSPGDVVKSTLAVTYRLLGTPEALHATKPVSTAVSCQSVG
jgi:hypothetical protein